MGLLGGTKIVVGSAVYNMAGDIDQRPEFLKQIILKSALVPNGMTMGESIVESYLGGPGMQLRSLYRWAKTNYSPIGLLSEERKTQTGIEGTALQTYVEGAVGASVYINTSEIGPANPERWAEQWFLENEPATAGTAYTVDVVDYGVNILVTREDTTTVTIPLTNYDEAYGYLYVLYQLTADETVVKMLIVKLDGSETALNGAFQNDYGVGSDYFPMIPFRLDTEFLGPDNQPSVYNAARKAYKRLTGSRLEKFIDMVAENENLDDIDYGHIVFGVPMNTKDKAAQRYLYEFFRYLRSRQEGTISGYNAWKQRQNDYESDLDNWRAWRAAGGYDDDGTGGGPAPTTGYEYWKSAPTTTITVKSVAGSNLHYDTDISWNAIREITGTGLAAPGKKKGDFWFENGTPFNYEMSLALGSIFEKTVNQSNDKITFYWQETETSWRAMEIHGMEHRAWVYKSNAVKTTLAEAIVDEEESVFLAPLHYPTFKAMPLTKATQMSTSCAYVHFTCYQIVKIKWYQTGFFKVFLVVGVIVLTAATGGLGAAGSGLLGSNAAVGAALGLAGATGALIGFALNMVAALIVTKIITKVATEIFGEELGTFIGMAMSFVAINMGSNFAMTGNFALNFNAMLSAEGLLKMTSAIGNAYANSMRANAQSWMAKAQEVQTDYAKETERLKELYAQNIGYANLLFDPMLLTGTDFTLETPDAFLSRTLMTGSDIAEITLNALSNFADITTSTTLPLH